jgi:hypothetical protein
MPTFLESELTGWVEAERARVRAQIGALDDIAAALARYAALSGGGAAEPAGPPGHGAARLHHADRANSANADRSDQGRFLRNRIRQIPDNPDPDDCGAVRWEAASVTVARRSGV